MNFSLTAPGKRRKNLDPVNYEKSMAKLIHMDLTPDEQKAVEALRRVTHDSVYGSMIRDSFIDESPEKFRQLFSEIMSQMDDNSGLMYQILGSEAYNCLLTIKPNHE